MKLTHHRFHSSMWRVTFRRRLGLVLSLGHHDFALLWSL